MNLKKWQKTQNISDKKLAKMLDIHVSYVSYLKNNKRRASPQLALKVEEISKHAVTIREMLYPEIESSN